MFAHLPAPLENLPVLSQYPRGPPLRVGPYTFILPQRRGWGRTAISKTQTGTKKCKIIQYFSSIRVGTEQRLGVHQCEDESQDRRAGDAQRRVRGRADRTEISKLRRVEGPQEVRSRPYLAR